jgi:hypothetical protein
VTHRLCVGVLAVHLVACGSRSGLSAWNREESEPPDVNECVTALECEVVDPCAPPQCIEEQGVFRCRAAPLVCDDLNPCTTDRCEPETGTCSHRAPADGDGDGFVAEADALAGCGGNDCDDENPAIYPGAIEICDGLDNDCDGGIDEGTVLASETAPVPLAPESPFATAHGGMAFTGDAFAVAYTEHGPSRVSYVALLTPGAAAPLAITPISQINADTFAGAVTRSDRGLFTAWADARMDGEYEIYATRFSFGGEKVQTDIRLSDAAKKSLHPAAITLGDEYIVLWDDRRFEDTGGGNVRLFGRRLSNGGALLGDEVMLARSHETAENPAMAAGDGRIGLVFTDLVGGLAHGYFTLLDSNLNELTAPVDLGVENVQDPTIAFVGDTFVVAFYTYTAGPGPALWGATFDRFGNLLQGAAPITAGDSYVRGHSLLSLGDRVFVTWSGADASGRYDIYAATYNKALRQIGDRQLLLETAGTAVGTLAVQGAFGQVGIVYDEMRLDGSQIAYFLALECRQQSLR